MAQIEFRNVSKSYGRAEAALHHIDLIVARGELLAVVGPSGCGKSTLLRLVAGLETLTDGELYIDGQCANGVPLGARQVAMVFQSYALYPHMNVRDNLAFALKVAKLPKAEMRARIDLVAEKLELSSYLDRLPKALSGGQRQRVAIGRALIRDPKIYLFDEPLSNLDASLRASTRLEIARLKAQMPDRTMIYVTHDQFEAMTLADRIVVLNKGEIAQIGTPMELYQTPKTTFVAQFIGTPKMNLCAGKIVQVGTQTMVQLDHGQQVKVAVESCGTDLGAVVQVGVRPEDLSVGRLENSLFTGTVELAEMLGEVSLLHFLGCDVVVKVRGSGAHLRGQNLTVSAAPDKLHLFHNGQSMHYR